jgi:nucleoside-diphosphate-sugar epimerase
MNTSLTSPVVIGAGPVGRAVTDVLLARGHTPTVVTRSGRPIDGATAVAADVANPHAAQQALADATTVFQCAQPEYHRWVEEFRPLQDSILSGCEAGGATLIAVENLYGYGPVDAPMTEDTPLAATTGKGAVRAQAWHDLKRAHDSGRVSCAAVRASDFFGPRVEESAFGARFLGPLLKGKSAQLMGKASYLHSVTYIPDLAEAMVRVADDPALWGRAWHAPTAAAKTSEEMVALAAAAAGTQPKHSVLPAPILRLVGLFNPGAKETVEMLYQFRRNFVLDSTASEQALGMAPTPLDESIAHTIEWHASTATAAP